MRRNLGTVLLGLGAFLVAFAPLLKFFVAPAIVAAPKDFWQVNTMRDDHASYFDTALDKTFTDVPVTMVSTLRGETRATTKDSIAVWDGFTVIKKQGADNFIAVQSLRYALDRHSGGLTSCCGAEIDGNTAVKQSGLGVIWPVASVEKKTYLYFDPTTVQAWPISYQGTDKVQGISAYRFVQSVPETRVAPMDPIPAKSLGLDPKIYKVPQPVDKYYTLTRTVWVDPRTGIPVSERDQMHAVAKTRDNAGQVVLADANLVTTPETAKALVKLSDDYAFKFGEVRGWGPALSLAAGLILLVAGAVLLYLPGRTSPSASKVKQVPSERPSSGSDPAKALPGFRPGAPPSSRR